jgi:hypothetical protein
MNEIWKPCVTNYEVSDAGRVRRSAAGRKTWAGRLLKPSLMAIGYEAVRPTVNGKNVHFYVHDLVAMAFIGLKPTGASVNHINGIKTDNRPSNLEYVTHAENMRHAADNELMVRGEDHPGHKMTEDGVRQLRADRASGLSYSKLAAKHGIAICTAYQIVQKKYWRHVA